MEHFFSVECRFRSDASGNLGLILKCVPVSFATRAEASAFVERQRKDARFAGATLREIRSEEVAGK